MKHRIAMARHGDNEKPQDRMLFDSGTAAHMEKPSDRVQNQQRYDTPILLANDLVVQAKYMGARTVLWNTETRIFKVTIPRHSFHQKLKRVYFRFWC